MSEPRSKRAKNEVNSDVENNADPTATLPDELLCQVLSYVPLRDKFQSEAVNHKFRRCVLHLLNNKPQPLEITIRQECFLNGHPIALEQFADAVRAFAAKAKFSSISLYPAYGEIKEIHEWLDPIFSALTTSINQCLSRVETVHLDAYCSGTILQEFIAKCGKLSNLHLLTWVQPLNSEPDMVCGVALDLATALKDKALTHLKLSYLSKFTRQQLLHLFGSIKPNTLRNADLKFCHFPKPDIVPGLIRELAGSAWAALEELQLLYAMDVDVVDFFGALAHLPKLHKCKVLFNSRPDDQFVPTLVSVFNSYSSIQFALHYVGCIGCFRNPVNGCEVINMVGQIQNIHPALQVDFGNENLILKQGNVTIENWSGGGNCDVVDCMQCHSFYPRVVYELSQAADDMKTMHLEGYQLDECRIESVVEYMNEVYSDNEGWEAVDVETNRAQATVTINFKENQGQGQFGISVGYGPCFSSSCIQCVNVD